jgi:hypothetical protein
MLFQENAKNEKKSKNRGKMMGKVGRPMLGKRKLT